MIGRYLRIERFFFWMLLFIPLSAGLHFFSDNQTLTFITSMLAIIPLARILGYATQEISLQTNPTIGGLVSATFGNVIELLIAILALREGLIRVVQASIVGSIIGNLLLLTGLSLFVGGLRYKQQQFNQQAAGVSSTMLIIVVTGLSIPSVFAFANPTNLHTGQLSFAVAFVLAGIYIAGLVFSLLTHKDLFDASDEILATRKKPRLSKRAAAVILFLTTVVVAVESEFLVKGIQSAALDLGITQTFIGIVIIAIVTNIAEKTSAIRFALENQIDLSIEIGTSSAIQIALFVVPILVFVSQAFGYDFSLVFSMFEVIAIVLAVMIINYLSADGVCNWLEGAQLLTVYFIIAIAFFFM